MLSSSMKFVNWVGFSNGMRGVDVEEPAAVGAELLDRDLRGDRSQRQHLVGALKRGRAGVVGERLHDAAGHEDQHRHDHR